jgi:glutamyl-tRNA synthetase
MKDIKMLEKAVTRFAPSPTGYLHIGGLRTALYSYLWAKKTNGEFKLRIEDTDQKRNSTSAVEAIFDAFSWVGMPSDCEVTFQSKRGDIYKKYIQQLLDDGKAYKCYMSKDELSTLRATQEANKQTPRYDGTWRPEDGKVLPSIPKDISPTIRIKAPKDGKIEFEDGIKGFMSFDASQVDDFIIARADQNPTYNFVVAVDDYLMGISDVIRGDDHLSNTPKQIVVYQALGFDIPKFFHIPMINNSQGKKLSKRDGAMNVMDYKELGFLPEALLNFLVRLGWSNKDQEVFSLDEMLELFNPHDINKSASAYNESKLLWLNSHYIKTVSNDRLIDELKYFDLLLDKNEKTNMVLELSKQRANTLLELKHSISTILDTPSSYDTKGVKKFIKEQTPEMLKSYMVLLETNKDNISSIDDVENLTKPFIKEHNLKFPQLFQPIRIALTGGTTAPSVYDIIVVLGIDESIKRINTAISLDFTI